MKNKSIKSLSSIKTAIYKSFSLSVDIDSNKDDYVSCRVAYSTIAYNLGYSYVQIANSLKSVKTHSSIIRYVKVNHPELYRNSDYNYKYNDVLNKLDIENNGHNLSYKREVSYVINALKFYSDNVELLDTFKTIIEYAKVNGSKVTDRKIKSILRI